MSTTSIFRSEAQNSATLFQRLHQIQDRCWMKNVLERVLAQLTLSPVGVDDYKVKYSKMNSCCEVAAFMDVSLRTLPDGKKIRQWFSCTFLASVAEGTKRFEEERRASMSLKMGFSENVTFLSDPIMIFRVFPLDPKLKGLAAATDPEQMREVFSKIGKEPCSEVSLKLLHYKPGVSCTLQYQVGSYHAYGKLFPDGLDKKSVDRLKASWEISQQSKGEWTAAAFLYHNPDWNFVLQEAVPGRRLRHVVSEGIEPKRLEQYLLTIVKAMRSYQTSGVQLGPLRDFSALFKEQEQYIGLMRSFDSQLADDLAILREEIVNLEPSIPASPIRFSHGDFAHGNLLIDDGKVSIIDFDRAGQAEMAYDAAYFLIHLISMEIYERFREIYLEMSPEVSSERLALYEALELSAYLLRNFRRQSHQDGWMEKAKKMLQSAKVCLRKATTIRKAQ